MKIRIADYVNDSIVDGFGIRFTVFTQGCPHHCMNCHNPSTHSLEGGRLFDTDKILSFLEENPLLDGITLSGGEPFIQAEACAVLAKGAHSLGLSVWTYTGYTFDEILNSGKKFWLELLHNTDVLVDGPYLEKERSIELPFRGSKNQQLIDVKQSIEKGEKRLFQI